MRKPTVVLVKQVLHENMVAIRLRLKAYIDDTQYEKAFETDVYLRAMAARREAGIAPPVVMHQQVASPVDSTSPS